MISKNIRRRLALILTAAAVQCVFTSCSDSSGSGVSDTLRVITSGKISSEQIGSEVLPDVITSDPLYTREAPVLTDQNPYYADSYAYLSLSPREKKLYRDILSAAENMLTEIDTAEDITDEEWLRAYGCVYNQECQLFWLSPRVLKGHILYRESDPEKLSEMRTEIENRADSICRAAKSLDDSEKLLYFHNRIIAMNDFSADAEYSRTIYGGLVRGSIQCEGYAKTFHYLCRKAGIPSMVVTGTNSEGDSHSWNIAMSNGNWYNVDCTWDDPVLAENDPENIRYNYFLVPDEWIHEISHFNINQKTGGTSITYFDTPECVSVEDNYFYKRDMVFSDADSADRAIRNALSDTVLEHMRTVEIMVSSESVYNTIQGRLTSYANWIKNRNPSVSAVADNSEKDLLIIELDLSYYSSNS